MLHIAGLPDQRTLLRFADALEHAPGVGTLTLIRGQLDDCWFTAVVPNIDTLKTALEQLHGFAVDMRCHAAGVDATVHAIDTTSPVQAPRSARMLQPDAVTKAPAPPPAARGAPADRAPLIAADARPGGAAPLREHLTLIVYPFRSFVTLNDFQGAVRGLHGVTNIRVRRFYRGTLHLGVEYEDMIPFVERLRDLRHFAWERVVDRGSEVEITLVGEPGSPEAPNGA